MIEGLPGEEFHRNGAHLIGSCSPADGFVDFGMGPAHMPISRCFGIDGGHQLEALDEHARTHVEDLGDACGDLAIAEFLVLGIADIRGVVGVHVEANRFGNPDGVGHLHQDLIADSCSDHVLGNMTRRIGG